MCLLSTKLYSTLLITACVCETWERFNSSPGWATGWEKPAKYWSQQECGHWSRCWTSTTPCWRRGWAGRESVLWALARSREQPRACDCWTQTALGAHSLKFGPYAHLKCQGSVLWVVARSKEQPRAWNKGEKSVLSLSFVHTTTCGWWTQTNLNPCICKGYSIPGLSWNPLGISCRHDTIS